MRAPDWLTARPVAHRGLHDRARGIVENMPSAVQAAIDGNFAIEVDVQLTADGEAMVHHDDALGRLNEGRRTARQDRGPTEGRRVQGHGGAHDDARRPLRSLVAGRVPLVIEIKSHFDGDRKLVTRMAEVLASYSGPAVGMSFDPDQVLRAARTIARTCARGIVAQRDYDDDYWTKHSAEQRRRHDRTAACASAPGRISWPTGSTSCRRPRPGSPATFLAARC